MTYLLLVGAAFIAEIASIFLVGSYVGWMWTLGLLALAVMLGFGLVSGRGPATLRRVIGALRQGRSPGAEILDGALFAIAGILFIIPGFMSDVLGVALLLPPVRAGIRARLRAWVSTRWELRGAPRGVIDVDAAGEPPGGDPDIIDTTARETREPRPPRGRSLPS